VHGNCIIFFSSVYENSIWLLTFALSLWTCKSNREIPESAPLYDAILLSVGWRVSIAGRPMTHAHTCGRTWLSRGHVTWVTWPGVTEAGAVENCRHGKCRDFRRPTYDLYYYRSKQCSIYILSIGWVFTPFTTNYFFLPPGSSRHSMLGKHAFDPCNSWIKRDNDIGFIIYRPIGDYWVESGRGAMTCPQYMGYSWLSPRIFFQIWRQYL